MDYGKRAYRKLFRLERMLLGESEEESDSLPFVGRELKVGKCASVTEIVRTVRLRTGSSGSLRITFFSNVSRAVSCDVAVDGMPAVTVAFSAGNTNASTEISGVDVGVHTVRIRIYGSTFTLNSLRVEIEGNILRRDGDTFVQGFEDGERYICLSYGRLEVFERASVTPYFSVGGVKTARCFMAGNNYYLAITCENGVVFICDVTSTLSAPEAVCVCGGATGACGVALTGGEIEIFVGQATAVGHFRYIVSEKRVLSLGTIRGGVSDICATHFDGRVILGSEKGGYVYVSEAYPFLKGGAAEQFTVLFEREV